MTDSVRVRFAPSPTGLPHVGNIRTALFNWLFARNRGGTFIARIEDTDVARKVEGATEAILDSLRWLGLDWDEGPGKDGPRGPYFQSQRLEHYRAHADRLLASGAAYLCYCSPQRLEEMRADQMRRKQPPGYDRRCRSLNEEERTYFEAESVVPVVRFKTPLSGKVGFTDLIKGEVSFDAATIDDFVLLKSDGYPTYHLASIVDDHLMRISHVLRADEWLASTPRHILLYRALGYEPPRFAHLPMILGEDRAKLSKRHGATAITEYRQMGYLPEALANYLALLGWSLDDRTELFTMEDLVRHFSIDRISKTAAIFSLKKLEWMNGIYIRKLGHQELLERGLPFLESGLPPSVPRPLATEYLLSIMPLVQDRVRTLAELPELTGFFLAEELSYDGAMLLGKGLSPEKAAQVLDAALGTIQAASSFDAESLEAALRPAAETLKLKTGDMFGVLRVAVTGRTAAPPLFQTMAVLGRERCLRRLEAARQRLLTLA